MMCEFVLMFWKDKPVDWLLEHMMYTRVCNPERDMHICQIEKRKIKVRLYFQIQSPFQLRDHSFGLKVALFTKSVK